MKIVQGRSTGNDVALYWFAKWYEATHGQAYTFTSAMQIARDAGINSNTAGRILKTSNLVRVAGQRLIVNDSLEWQ